jgi:hypothetical protein
MQPAGNNQGSCPRDVVLIALRGAGKSYTRLDFGSCWNSIGIRRATRIRQRLNTEPSVVKGNNISRSLVVNATKQRVNATKQRVSRLSSLWMASDGCLAHLVPWGRTVASFSRLGLRKRHERHKTPGAFHPQPCPLFKKE